jgi:hypothetical protein
VDAPVDPSESPLWDSTPADIRLLTQAAAERHECVVFAGFLVREDAEAAYIADREGTWVIRREDLVFLQDWAEGAQCAPDMVGPDRRAVRVGVAPGAIMHEIRPWKTFLPVENLYSRNVARTVDAIFTLGGEETQPEQHNASVNRLAMLERAFARQLGWDPRNPTPTSSHTRMRTSSGTATCVDDGCWWGYSDSD